MPQAAFRDSELLIGKALGETYQRENKTESYVEIPPALIITAPNGVTFTLGFNYQTNSVGDDMEFNVLVNDRDSGQFASRIVMRAGVVQIFGRAGTRTWSERHKNFV